MEPIKNIEDLRAELLAAIDEQIVSRRHAMSQMVGTLYPSITQDQINKLRLWKEKLKE